MGSCCSHEKRPLVSKNGQPETQWAVKTNAVSGNKATPTKNTSSQPTPRFASKETISSAEKKESYSTEELGESRKSLKASSVNSDRARPTMMVKMMVHVRLREGEEKIGVKWDVNDLGVYAREIEEASPGSMAGVQPKWILLDIDGTTIRNRGDLTSRMDTLKKHRGGCLRMAPSYSLAEVALHNTLEDIWIVIGRKVYDVTTYVTSHPGGPRILQRYAGRSATTHFYKIHSNKAKALLDRFHIGYVRVEQGGSEEFLDKEPVE
eukprot:TRINITY_DN7469_c1_g1_i1.p1 TRINITY_DN7469_c1_g1~~TRINITY_DN7469_c1_g1_i1.p1  ORF type:complete len:264 (+),score=30.50 TRINITY_DN7469_c1_g1_i1:34-825(+)